MRFANRLHYLRGDLREARLDEVTLGLVAEMLLVGGIESDREKAVTRADDAVRSGNAAEVFGRMIAALGGPADFVDNCDRYLPSAPVQRPVVAESEGVLVAVDGRHFGNAIIELGGGRRKVDDELDLSVGFCRCGADRVTRRYAHPPGGGACGGRRQRRYRLTHAAGSLPAR